MSTVVVLPTYNEASNLPELTHQLLSLPLPHLSVLVVDDASPDGTGQVADELVASTGGRVAVLHRAGKLGLGTAYREGFERALNAGAGVLVQMDADFSHSPDHLLEMVAHLDEYDVVIGSRYVPGGRVDERWGPGRRLLSAWANLYARTILGIQIQDATAGFKAWRRETLLGMDLSRINSNGYVFQVEMTYVAQRLGFRALEIPIYFEDRHIGQSKMTIPIKFEAAWRVWQVWWRHHSLSPQNRRGGPQVA